MSDLHQERQRVLDTSVVWRDSVDHYENNPGDPHGADDMELREDEMLDACRDLITSHEARLQRS